MILYIWKEFVNSYLNPCTVNFSLLPGNKITFENSQSWLTYCRYLLTTHRFSPRCKSLVSIQLYIKL